MNIKIEPIEDIDAFIEQLEREAANPELIDGIPAHTYRDLKRYLEIGEIWNDFLIDFLCCDLRAIGRADDINIQFIVPIYKYLVNKIPACAWGSHEQVRQWINQFKEEE